MNPYETLSPQARTLYDHMTEHGSITSAEAYEKYGIFRTASRIHEIRKAGIGIKTTMKTGKNRFGVDCHYAEYSLE